MILLLALALWPWATGIKSVQCYEHSPNPAGDNCAVELTDRDPAHEHTVILRYTDGTARTAIFKGPGQFIPLEGKRPVDVRLFGKRARRVKP